jgi:hypothetical protein
MDPGAYRCPRCLIYFCFKCRRRVQQRDEQFQCMNQQCGQYGKMLCNACIVEVPVMGEGATGNELVTAEVPGYDKPRFSIKVRALMGLAYFVATFAFTLFSGGERRAVCTWVLCTAPIVFWMLAAKVQVPAIPKVYRAVWGTVEVGKTKSCIACRQPVQHL